MLTGYDHMVDVVKLHASYLFISCYLVHYCKCLLKLRITLLLPHYKHHPRQLPIHKAVAHSQFGLELNKNVYNDCCLLFLI